MDAQSRVGLGAGSVVVAVIRHLDVPSLLTEEAPRASLSLAATRSKRNARGGGDAVAVLGLNHHCEVKHRAGSASEANCLGNIRRRWPGWSRRCRGRGMR